MQAWWYRKEIDFLDSEHVQDNNMVSKPLIKCVMQAEFDQLHSTVCYGGMKQYPIYFAASACIATALSSPKPTTS
jgi:hypothetical protein